MAGNSPSPDKLARARLLVVDDEPYNRDLLERVFARQADVVTAADADDALAALTAADGAFAAVVTDQRLARGRGTQLAAAIRTRWPAIRIVVITGYTDDPDLLAARAAGTIDDLVAKPWLPPTLRARVLGPR